MENNKQTAVEWLVEQLKKVDYNPLEQNGYSKAEERLFDQAKEMEKQQIIQTYHKSALNEATHIIAGTSHISAEQYYNETYGKNTNDNTNL